MFIRSEFKARAKDVLKRNYWTCFFVTLVMLILGGSKPSVQLNFNYSTGSEREYFDTFAEMIGGVFFPWFKDFVYFALPMLFIFAVAGFLITLLVINVLEIGKIKFFLDAKDNHYDFKTLGFAFRHPGFLNVVKISFFLKLYIFLWTLLFIVPGLIASLRYRFVKQIVAENPNIDMSEAFNLSIEMTNGIKMDLFILDLSFFGWYLLNIITFGLATFFIAPYVAATEAEVYKAYLNKTSSILQ